MKKYQVKDKDSLWKIARHFGVTVEALATANNLRGRQLHYIRIGQILNIPDEPDISPDTTLLIDFKSLDFLNFTPKTVKACYDGKEEVFEFQRDYPFTLAVDDHSSGLKLWVETLDRQYEPVLETETLPLGKWKLSVNSRMVKGEGSLQPKVGPASEKKSNVKDALAHNAQLANGKNQQQQTRTEGGEPVHGMAALYTEKNLRLLPGNERFRKFIIAAAEKYDLTPQSLAALIDAEASKVAGVWQEKSNQSHPKKPQGLAQFYEPAWATVYDDEKSLLNKECQTLSKEARLAKRLDARYAIDGAASYASYNLDAFERSTNFAVKSLSAEDKAKVAYMLHHEGLDGALRLFGKKPQLEDKDMVKRLKLQLGEDNAEMVQSLLKRYNGDPAAAYKGWLFSYIDANICVTHFVIDDEKRFATPPRSMAAIAQTLSSSYVVVAPKPKSTKKAGQTAPKPSQPTESKPSGIAASAHQDKPLNVTINTESRWHDPLAVCTLRTAHLASKKGAMFGWTRSGGKKCHQGIDLAADPGTPIYAVADGTVYCKPASDPGYDYGNTLILEVGINDLPPKQAAEFRRINPNSPTIGFFYAHLSEMLDNGRKPVKCGQIIGTTGSSGNAKNMTSIALGAHLHFEVRLLAREKQAGLNNRADPLPFIENCTNR
jgi:murein DD-endopeptidase MepM/ murein hydrolase activator NlpD